MLITEKLTNLVSRFEEGEICIGEFRERMEMLLPMIDDKKTIQYLHRFISRLEEIEYTYPANEYVTQGIDAARNLMALLLH